MLEDAPKSEPWHDMEEMLKLGIVISPIEHARALKIIEKYREALEKIENSDHGWACDQASNDIAEKALAYFPADRLAEIEVRQSNQNILPSDSFWLLARVKKLTETGTRIVNDPVLSSQLAQAIWNQALEEE